MMPKYATPEYDTPEYLKRFEKAYSIDISYAAVRARNLAEEMSLSQGDKALYGPDIRLTGWALEFYETQCTANVLEQDRDEYARWAIERVAMYTSHQLLEGGKNMDHIGVVEAGIAEVALRHFSDWLFSRLDEPEAEAA